MPSKRKRISKRRTSLKGGVTSLSRCKRRLSGRDRSLFCISNLSISTNENLIYVNAISINKNVFSLSVNKSLMAVNNNTSISVNKSPIAVQSTLLSKTVVRLCNAGSNNFVPNLYKTDLQTPKTPSEYNERA